MIAPIRKFTDSTNFTNAIKVTVAAVIPVLMLSYLGCFEMGLAVGIGAFLTYPSDIPSNLKHKIYGVLAAAVIVTLCNLVVNLLYPFPVFLYPVIAGLIFFLSMISVYGQRANMVSFSGLLAIALAFGHIHSGGEIFMYAGLMLLGGIFYLLVSLLFYFIRPHHYIELQVAECIRLTSKYLKLRGKLWDINADREKIIEKQLHLQVELNTVHENIREILIRNRPDLGDSNQSRKMLLVFISLVEILELALSTSFDHSKLHEKFDQHPKLLATYQNLAYNLAAALKQLSDSIVHGKTFNSHFLLTGDLEKLERAVNDYAADARDTKQADNVWMLSNMLHYAEKQIDRIKVVERAYTGPVNRKDLSGKDKDLEKFITPLYYPWRTLRENLEFSSSIFRHSLRLTITIFIGFALGALFPLQNIYWILLTIVVILRPGYGLTKERSYQRVLGTVLGAIIAFALLSVVHDPTVIGVLGIICLVLGFSFTTINYKIGALFVTVYVVLLYGMMTPNINDVIQFRVIDTLIGCILAFGANYFLWPTWEFLNIPNQLKKSIEANGDYLKQIALFYEHKGEVTSSYRLARKHAFVEIGNLMASFQRMSQEPKSKQKQLPNLYKLVVLNHSLLSSLASLGTYIQSHKTTTASEAFKFIVETAVQNLDAAVAVMDAKDENLEQTNSHTDVTSRIAELKKISANGFGNGHLLDNVEFKTKMQESQLVIEQLVWMTNLSRDIVKATRKLQSGIA